MNEQAIKIQLPDGSVREVPRGTTANEVAMSISPRLAAAVVVARIRPLAPVATNGNQANDDTSEAAMYGSTEGGERLVDLAAPLNEDVALIVRTALDGLDAVGHGRTGRFRRRHSTRGYRTVARPA